jgi:hypothetical protein
VRTYPFFIVSALSGMLALAAFGGQPNAEPSELQMERPFGEFLAKVEAKPLSEIQIIAFKKHSCRETGTPGYYCSFTYSTKVPPARFSVLPAEGTLSGMFFSDQDGRLRFEMVIG